MRKYWILLIALLVAMVVAAPVSAKKGGGNGPPDPIEGFTCGESTLVTWGADHTTFTLSLTGKDWKCVDVDDVPAGDWTVDVTVGSARSVTVQLRSSVPGDWCWSESTNTDTTFTGLYAPASGLNACPYGGAGGEPIPDSDPALAFTAFVTGGNKLATPAEITVTLPTS